MSIILASQSASRRAMPTALAGAISCGASLSLGKSLSHHACTSRQRCTSDSTWRADCIALLAAVVRAAASQASRKGPRGGWIS